MRSAIAFGLIVVIFAVLMPEVFHAMDTFLLVLFNKATAVLNTIPSQTATMSQSVH